MKTKVAKLFEIEGWTDDALWYVITIRDFRGDLVDTIHTPTQAEAIAELRRKGYEY